MPYPVKCLLEVSKDMVKIFLVLQVLFAEDSKEKNFCSTVSCLKAGLFFSDGGLCLWLESVKDDLQHDFTWVADEALLSGSFDTIVGCLFLEV